MPYAKPEPWIFLKNLSMDDCIFCKIIKKELPSTIEFEDEDIIVFHDIHPSADLHLLIVPKIHLEGIQNIGSEHEELLGRVFTVINKLVTEKNLTDKNYRVVVNGGKSQIVPHLHFHLLGGKWYRFV